MSNELTMKDIKEAVKSIYDVYECPKCKTDSRGYLRITGFIGCKCGNYSYGEKNE